MDENSQSRRGCGTPRRTVRLCASAAGVVLACGAVQARDYYIAYHADGGALPVPVGSDDAPGTISQPWRTLARLQSVQLQADDTVYLACGGLWREALKLTTANVKGAPVKVTGYDAACPDARPVIDGAVRLSSTQWVASARHPGVYEYTGILAAPRQLIVDGVPMKVARYPEDGYLPVAADTVGSQDHLAVSAGDDALLNALSGPGGLVGADIHVRTQRWLVETRPVSGHTSGEGGDIRFDAILTYPARKDFGFYLDNQEWMLGNPGQWFFDRAVGKLYFKPPAGATDIAALTIEASQVDQVVDVEGIGGVEIAGLEVRNAARYGVMMLDTPRARVTGNLVVAAGETGIGIMDGSADPRGRDDVRVDGNVVRHSKVWGIRGRATHGLAVVDNLVEDTGIALGPASDSLGQTAPRGIGVGGESLQVSGNVVRRSAYAGISFDNRDATIRHNVVEDSCLQLSDCGAIYTYNAHTPASLQGAQVEENLIERVSISRVGTPDARTNAPAVAAGLYFDNQSTRIHAVRNSVFDAEFGIVLNGATEITVARNRFLKAAEACFLLSDSDTGNAYDHNQCLAGGQAFGNAYGLAANEPVRAGRAVSLGTALDYRVALYGNSFSGNTYAGVYGPVLFKIDRNADAANDGNLLNPSQWSRLQGGRDAGRRPLDVGLSLFRAEGVTDAGLVRDGDFAREWPIWSEQAGNPATSVMKTGRACDDAPCQQFTVQTRGDIMMSNEFSLKPGGSYVFSYESKSPRINARVPLTIRHAATPYESLGFDHRAWLGPEWRRFSVPFVATADAGGLSVRLDIYGIPTQPILVDNVSLQEAAAIAYNSTADDVLDLENASGNARAFDCPSDRVASCDDYVDVAGDPVAWPVIVPAWRITALAWKGSPFGPLRTALPGR
jgi:hypothetical protein